MLAPLVVGASASAWAAEPVLAHARPETWDMTRQELQAIGLGQSRGDPRPVPPEYPRRNLGADDDGSHGPGDPDPWVIFVNFDGETLTSGMDSAQQNITQIFELAGPFEAYGGDATQRDAVLQAVMADWAAYNMVVVDQRPAEGEYVMNMTGPTNPFGGGVLGIAPVDCSNLQTHSNVTFAFHSANDGFSAAIQATTIGQEVAHSFGLEHVDEPNDIMNPYNAGGDPTFIDECIPIVGGSVCPQQHLQHCPDGTGQNAHQELLTLFGPAIVDTDPPVVLITAPLDGQEFEAGSDFSVVVNVTDDSPITQVELLHDGVPVMLDTMEPWGFAITNVPAGTHVLQASAVDENGNEGVSAQVTLEVIEIGGTEGETDGAGQDEDGKGCGCRHGGAGGPWPWMLVLLGPALRRRR
ncbi:Ig-like domain-containing protein [Paraliomyxa miuraensis]|nr:Ig-like domain-containing protein [Paraliomyxa miuraensis]